MGRPATIDELDMLAYADGYLDCDPITKAHVEAQIAQSPELESRVRAYVMQTEALREAYGKRLAEPIPDRFLDILHRPAALRGWGWGLNLAVVVAITFGGIAGWLVGNRPHVADSAENRLVHAAYANFVSPPKRQPVLVQAGQDNSLSALEHAAPLRIRAPDLAKLGFVLVKQRAIREHGNRLLRFAYRAADGRTLSLYVGPRWTEARPGIRIATEGHISIAHWLQGPMVSVLVSRLSADKLGPLAEQVRHSMRHPQQRDPMPNPGAVKPGLKRPTIASDQGRGPIPAAVLQSTAPRSGSAIPD